MKLKLLVAIGMCSFVLVSCGVDNSDKKADATSSAVLTESQGSDIAKDDKLVTKGKLLKVGQYTKSDETGKAELLKIASPGNKIEVASNVFVTFGDIKIIHFTEIPQSSQEDFSLFYGFEGNEGYDLQFEYMIENKNDYQITNSAVDKVILSDGEQIDRSVFIDEAYDLEAESKASNQIGHVNIPHPDIDSVKFYIEPIKTEIYEELDSKPIEVKFN